jgi:anti-sigma B factor antagonist
MSEAFKTASKLVPSARKEGDALVASVAGEIDLNNSPELRTTLLGLLAKSPSKRIILNLAQVPYMDSSAVAVLVELLRKLNGGKLILTDLQKRVQGLLEVAKLSTIFKIVATEKEALG